MTLGAPFFRIKLGEALPNLPCQTATGVVELHTLLSRPPVWTVLVAFGHDSPSACIELSECEGLAQRCLALGAKLVAVASGTAVRLLNSDSGVSVSFPVLLDERAELAKCLGIWDFETALAVGTRTAANAVMIVGPNKTIRCSILYPSTVGRRFDEVYRCLESLFLTQDFSLATPANWHSGGRVVVAPTLGSEEARARFKNFEAKLLPSQLEYLRYVDCPDMSLFSAPESEIAPGICGVGPMDFKGLLGEEFPNFPCSTTEGDFTFHDFLDREPRWTMLFSHPKDFTPVCTTELGVCQSLATEFERRGIKMIGLSCDSVEMHHAWSRDILAARGLDGDRLAFPLIGDEDRYIASSLGMLDPLEKDGEGVPMPARSLFVIDASRRLRLMITYPATTGRNFFEILRIMSSWLPLAQRSSPACDNEASYRSESGLESLRTDT